MPQKSNIAPILLFAYNRPNETLKTLKALAANDLSEQSILFVFIDGPKTHDSETIQKVESTKNIVQDFNWPGTIEIKTRTKNLGLSKSITSGVTEIISNYEKVIVLEDDLITSRGFLKFMNSALTLYKEDEKVMGVSGHIFPIENIQKNSFLLRYVSTWGWGTWKRSWNEYSHDLEDNWKKIKTKNQLTKFNLDDSYPYETMVLNSLKPNSKIDSWGIRWYLSVFLKNGLYLYPKKSLVTNIGFGEDAQHSSNDLLLEEIAENPNKTEFIEINKVDVEESKTARNKLARYLKQKHYQSIWSRFKNVISKTLNYFR